MTPKLAAKKTSGLLRPKKGERFGGRTKGTPNKVTVSVKYALASAADRLGGIDRLVAWAKEDPINERLFWSSMYPKLLPLTLAGDPNNPIEIVHKIERIITNALGDDNVVDVEPLHLSH